MKINSELFSNKRSIVLAVIGGILLVTTAFGVGAFVASAATFTNFPPQFFIAGVDVSGKTVSDATSVVSVRAADLQRSGVSVSVPNFSSQRIPVYAPYFDIDGTMSAAKYAAERDAVTKRIKSALNIDERIDVPFETTELASEAITDDVISNWKISLSAPTNARFEIVDGVARVIPAVRGQVIDRSALSNDFVAAIGSGEQKIVAQIITSDPKITTAMAEGLQTEAAALAEEVTHGRTLEMKDKKFKLTPADLTALIQPRVVDGKAIVGIDANSLKEKFGSALEIFEQPAKDAAFAYQGNRASIFVPDQPGVVIDWDVLARNLFASLSTSSSTITIATTETPAKIALAKTNNLGINEVIGYGTSDASGSTPSRLHNIATGMAAIKNVLIAPGETFSLIKTLGAIDGTSGYVQELVIKDNKTQPEYGGGLCQIGTTTFRAAMGAGFPIVERQNHSYQVHYYFENGVSGTDATIYDPKPDFRFTNDTGHWVLLDPEINGVHLTFTFWGTRDGRIATRTIPKILNTTPPPDKKVIETTALPVGKKKCTELAHVGANVIFYYTVTYADGTVKKQDFPSHYKPWGEVCLVGVAATSTPSGTALGALNISPDAAGVAGN
ncbi:MAG: VanW family protein [Candidatus Magasanikbacteria bacterium]|nr:VanW family protein [Candidatus Magasanikbacteria bacterium]